MFVWITEISYAVHVDLVNALGWLIQTKKNLVSSDPA